MAHATATIGTDRYRTVLELHDQTIIADEPGSRGGSDLGPAPYDLLLASLGACTAMTLRMYADRKGWPLEKLEVDLHFRGGDAPQISRTLRISGLDGDQQARLAEIAERTPVTLTLKSGVAIDTSIA
jgi:putative redox protein